MDKSSMRRRVIVFAAILVALLIAIGVIGSPGGHDVPISEVMRDAVLHESSRIDIFGISINPGLMSAFMITAVALVAAVIIRVAVIPRFSYVPGRCQLVLEELVGVFDRLAKSNSPGHHKFLGTYIFTAGVYIFTSTVFELFGAQWVTTSGTPISLPAPLSDINGAIMMGVLSYGIILTGGLIVNGAKGLGHALKDFSLPISMSFRLFGALLSGALVTELIYHYIHLSFVLPAVVGVLFTLLHALIQAYVLTMLTALFFGEVTGD